MKLLRPSAKKLIAFLITITVITACELETTVPKATNPDDRQYQGTWLGNTSQTKLLTFDVENSSDGPVVSSCLLGYLNHYGYKQRKLINTSGLSEISNGSFSFVLPDGGTFEASFSSPGECAGSYEILDNNNGGIIKHSFKAVANTSRINLLSTARVSFFLDKKDYEYEQDFDLYFPATHNINTDTGIIAVTGFNRKYGDLADGLPLIEIRTSNLETPDDIAKLFSPGVKQLSKNAENGFEIIYFDRDESNYLYSTSACSGNQDWSELEIIDFIEIETFDPDYKLYKFIARFHCKACKNRRPDKYLAKGFYIGYINTRL